MAGLVEKFFSGDYAGLVRSEVDAGDLSRFSAREQAYLVGALVFVGRRSDAKAEFAAHLKKASADAQAIARFFLAVGASRDSSYEEARALLAENFRARGKVKGEEARFFLYQGWGFFRYFHARFGKAALWSERAWRVAYKARFRYGMTLSADLRGHSLLQVGEVARGLRSLEEAAEHAATGAIRATLETSALTYRAQFGLLPEASKKLLAAWKKLATSDTYSRANLLLERARSLLLEGKATEASQWLDEGAGEIFRHGHRRQKAAWLARRAAVSIAQGQKAEALQSVERGLAELEAASDPNHRLELLELRFAAEPDEETRAEVERLRKWIGRKPAPESPLFQWREMRRKDAGNPELAHLAVTRGWLGLLGELVEPEGELLLYLELLPGKLVIFRRGNVEVSREGVPEILKRLLMALSFSASSKEALLEKVWGYRYDPLRHDPLLYNSIYRLRALLGSAEAHLVAESNGYRWDLPAKVRVFERDYAAPEESEPVSESLSLRQHRALQALKSGAFEAISVGEYAAKYRVSKPTATRDLAELLRKGYLARTGRARATAYLLREKQ